MNRNISFISIEQNFVSTAYMAIVTYSTYKIKFEILILRENNNYQTGTQYVIHKHNQYTSYVQYRKGIIITSDKLMQQIRKSK